MTMSDKPLGLGYHDVALECPDCGDSVIVTVEMLTVRQNATDEAVTLRLKAKAKKVVHVCGQLAMFGREGLSSVGGP